jgi:RTX calcium-binding nonapeptide repeat (4 copies)
MRMFALSWVPHRVRRWGVYIGGMSLARRALVAGVVAASLAAPLVSPVEAAEVSLERETYDCRMCPPIGLLVVRAGSGEANRMNVAPGPAGEVQVTDVGAPLRAGPGCTAVGEQRVDCPTSVPDLRAFVFAGDRDDTVSSAVGANLDGGRGNDRLAGSPDTDALYGGGGRDVLRGGDGDDALQDGRLLTPSEPEWVGPWNSHSFVRSQVAPVRAQRDVIDGGVGFDTLGYTGRELGVVVDLASRGRDAGARGERDSLRMLEGVVGTDGDDRLLGSDSANLLHGEAGDDLLVGRGGDDRLGGSTGSNRVRGDAGDDLIGVDSGSAAPPLGRQRVSCGPGRDRIEHLFPNDFGEDDCESVDIVESTAVRSLLPPLSLRRPPLVSASECVFPDHCDTRLEVRLARSPDRRRPRLKGLVLAQARGTLPSPLSPEGTETTLTAHLSARGSRVLRRYRTLLIRIRMTGLDDSGSGVSGAYLTRLRAPALTPPR